MGTSITHIDATTGHHHLGLFELLHISLHILKSLFIPPCIIEIVIVILILIHEWLKLLARRESTS
jgi:hypothetical protein